jgi:hypothetical protein
MPKSNFYRIDQKCYMTLSANKNDTSSGLASLLEKCVTLLYDHLSVHRTLNGSKQQANEMNYDWNGFQT